jgi:hypothetical protein
MGNGQIEGTCKACDRNDNHRDIIVFERKQDGWFFKNGFEFLEIIGHFLGSCLII